MSVNHTITVNNTSGDIIQAALYGSLVAIPEVGDLVGVRDKSCLVKTRTFTHGQSQVWVALTVVEVKELPRGEG